MDGVTFDYESPLAAGDPAIGYYTAIVAETDRALKAAHAGYQTSVCAAWSPDDIDGRDYDYKSLARAVDFLYLMVSVGGRAENRLPLTRPRC